MLHKTCHIFSYVLLKFSLDSHLIDTCIFDLPFFILFLLWPVLYRISVKNFPCMMYLFQLCYSSVNQYKYNATAMFWLSWPKPILHYSIQLQEPGFPVFFFFATRIDSSVFQFFFFFYTPNCGGVNLTNWRCTNDNIVDTTAHRHVASRLMHECW